jgi:hypothetical protein
MKNLKEINERFERREKILRKEECRRADWWGVIDPENFDTKNGRINFLEALRIRGCGNILRSRQDCRGTAGGRQGTGEEVSWGSVRFRGSLRTVLECWRRGGRGLKWRVTLSP